MNLSDYTKNSADSISYKLTNPIRFPGQYDDSDTKDIRSLIINNANGLYYNWNRWYNPDIGRYVEVDPYEINIGCNNRSTSKLIYSYVDNIPTMFTDFRGEELDYQDISSSCLSIRQEIKQSYDDICRNEGSSKLKACLPPDLFNKLSNACSKKLEIECPKKLKDNSHCAQHPIGSNRIHFIKNIDKNFCGCIDSILMHELLHYGGEMNDNRTLACEINCYGKDCCKRKECNNYCAGDCR